MIRQINIWLAAVGFLCAYRIAVVCGCKADGQRLLWVLALFPYSIIQTASFASRESLIIVLLMHSVLSYVKWTRDHTFWAILSAIASSLLLVALHTGMLAVPCSMLFLSSLTLIRGAKIGRARIAFSALISLTAIAGLLVLIFATGWGLEKFGDSNERLNLDGLSKQQQGTATGRAAYLESTSAGTLLDIVLTSPIRLAYFIGAPFPWMITRAIDVVGCIDGLAYVLILLGIVKNWRHAKQSVEIRALLLFSSALIIVFGLSVSNYGTAMRHRLKLLPMLVCAYVVSRHSRRPWAWYPRIAVKSPTRLYNAT